MNLGNIHLSSPAYKRLVDLGMTPVYSSRILNSLEYISLHRPFSTAFNKDMEALVSGDIFLPHQRTAGNLDTPLGAEVLVDGEFAVQVANVLTNWPRSGMTEDSYSEVAPYSGISHAVIVDDNAADYEMLVQNQTLIANMPYRFSAWLRSASGTLNNCRLIVENLNDGIYDSGSKSSYINVTTTYANLIKYFKPVTDTSGQIVFSGINVAFIGTYYVDLASLRPIVLAAFPNYTLGTADGATGDRYGSYVMARSDGGIEIYKGPLAGAAGTNDITYTKSLTTVIGQVYTVVYTAYSDGTGTGKVTFGTEVSAIAATVTTPTTVSFQFTATDVITDLVLEAETPDGKMTFKGVSVR